MTFARHFLLLVLAGFLPVTATRAFEIKLDYTYDSQGFFADAARKSTLEAAARSWEQKLAGAQTPAIPLGTGGNTWTLSFNRPDINASLGGANTSIVNKPLPANTVIIYVGARPDVYGGYLGYAEFNYSALGSSSWVQMIQARNSGERFAGFGGAIAFDSSADWYFDQDPGTKEDHPGKTDFYTLAMHEIGHLLGFTHGAAAFSRLALGGKFNGPRVMALNGGMAPELGIGGHWPGGYQFQNQPMVMAPGLGWNERALLNPLEVAVLQDIGYSAETGVRVVLLPAAAASAGAEWRIGSGAWKKSGDTLSGLPPGERTLTFKTPAAYLPPEARTITLDEGELLEVTVDFVPVPAPAVQSPPQSLLAEAGTAAHLEIQADTGGVAPKYRWRKGGKVLSKAVGPQMDFASLKTSDAGVYDVVVSTAGGTTPPLAAQIGVVGAVSGPDIIHEGGTLKLKQTAAGPGLSYQWFRNDQPLQDDLILGISGAASNQLQIKNVTGANNGSYHCLVSMDDPAAGVLEQAGPVKQVAVLLRPVIDDLQLGPWRVSGEVADLITAQNSPVSFQVSGLPRGVRLDRRSGRLSGRPLQPGPLRLVVSASNAAGRGEAKEFWVPCAGLEPLWQGQFSGLVARGELNGELGGMIALKVSSTGAISGHLTLDGKRRILRGVLDPLPGPDASALLRVNRGSNLNPLRLHLRIGTTDGHLTGLLSDDEESPAVSVEGWQSQWHARNHPATAFAGDLASALLPAEEVITEEESDPETTHTESSLIPEGTGYATAKISNAGVVTWAGRLADGSAHTQSVILTAQGLLPLHALLYQGGGSAQGWAALSTRTETAPDIELNGLMDWCKIRAVARDRAHASGFPLCEIILAGGSRRPREAAVIQLDLPVDEEKNAAVRFDGGGLEDAELGMDTSIDLTISASNRVTLPHSDDNPAATRIISLNTKTNVFTGSFVLSDDHPDTGLVVVRRVKFQGLLVPRLRQGVGWFLLPQLTTENPAPLRSGNVLLEAAP